MRSKTVSFLFCAAMVFSGCSQKAETRLAPMQVSVVKDQRTLAYEHVVELRVSPDKVVPAFETVQQTCAAARDEQCAVLESHVGTGEYASARVKLRAAPVGIEKVIAAVRSQGEILNQSTTTEDLAAPIDDAAKRFAMLRDYESKLEALRGKASADVDSLIKVSKELAQVGSDIESVTKEQANLERRVATQLLTVEIGSHGTHSFGRPIADAVGDFGENLSEGIAIAVTGVAYLLPWALLLAIVFWLGRKVWRRMRMTRAP